MAVVLVVSVVDEEEAAVAVAVAGVVVDEEEEEDEAEEDEEAAVAVAARRGHLSGSHLGRTSTLPMSEKLESLRSVLVSSALEPRTASMITLGACVSARTRLKVAMSLSKMLPNASILRRRNMSVLRFAAEK